MKVIKLNLKKFTQSEIELIVENLRRGAVMAYPTDTVYGLGCNALDIAAVKKVNKIKGEKGKKPLIILISDFAMLRRYCFFNQEQEKYLRGVWLASLRGRSGPGPVTVILKRRPILSDELTGGLNSIAVRLPENEFLIKIMSTAGFPLVSTSLNKKGEKPLAEIKNLEKHFKYLPDLAIDAGELTGKPSKLIDLMNIKNIKIIRK